MGKDINVQDNSECDYVRAVNEWVNFIPVQESNVRNKVWICFRFELLLKL